MGLGEDAGTLPGLGGGSQTPQTKRLVPPAQHPQSHAWETSGRLGALFPPLLTGAVPGRGGASWNHTSAFRVHVRAQG